MQYKCVLTLASVDRFKVSGDFIGQGKPEMFRRGCLSLSPVIFGGYVFFWTGLKFYL